MIINKTIIINKIHECNDSTLTLSLLRDQLKKEIHLKIDTTQTHLYLRQLLDQMKLLIIEETD